MNAAHRSNGPQHARTVLRETTVVAMQEARSYVDMPVRQLLFRYLWPFWMFKDANRGDRITRAAAYRHNRGMRIYLPGYLLKWFVSCTLILALSEFFNHLSQDVQGTIDIFLLMGAGLGMVFACGLCVMLITAYVYLYLSHHDCEC